jgi:hypothetical protein
MYRKEEGQGVQEALVRLILYNKQAISLTERKKKKQCLDAAKDYNLLNLVFADFADLWTVSLDSGLVIPDTYYLPLSIDVYSSFASNTQNGCNWQLHFAL